MAKQNPFDAAIEYAMTAASETHDIATLPAPVRNVALVHAAQGVIDNGGFQYFFEADFPAKPDYSVFVEAYRAIGADQAAQIIEQAVALFPFPSPHKHLRERTKFLDSYLDEDDEPVDSPFEPLTKTLCGDESVWAKLERYVTNHSPDFRKPQ